MQVEKVTMFQLAVADMPKAKEFYADKLGMKVKQDYRQDDDNWWVSLVPADGGTTITLTTHHSHMKPGALTLYLKVADVTAAHDELADNGVEVKDVQNDLYGPGSGVHFFQVEDPDGNLIHVVEA